MRHLFRHVLACLPREQRFAIYRSFVDCDLAPSSRLVLKIAETKEELQGCFEVLHNAYVDSGFMKPDPSGMRVTIHHALPTTTMLCAKYDNKVVGTVSLIRESALGIPLQAIFDLGAVREKEGQIAEASALAIHRDFRHTGGSILFPLMKFMYEYCKRFFDTRHLVIAVNPSHIEMYESLLFFRRLTPNVVESYDFVNGAPAIGATLDLTEAPDVFREHYAGKPPKKNLYAYFVDVKLPHIRFPNRRFYTTNDAVLTPELLDYFFNVRTRVFRDLEAHKKVLLHAIYDLPEYAWVLPRPPETLDDRPVRRHQRFSVKCPASVTVSMADGQREVPMLVLEVSRNGLHARAHEALPRGHSYDMTVHLGSAVVSHFQALLRHEYNDGSGGSYGFSIEHPDADWEKFVSALYGSTTSVELESNTAA